MIEYKDFGLVGLEEAWEYQEKLFQELMKKKLNGTTDDDKRNYLLFCEHPPVFTLGKSGKDNNLLINEELLKQKGIEFYRINRGGILPTMARGRSWATRFSTWSISSWASKSIFIS